MPERRSSSASTNASAPSASEVTTPRPVMTTCVIRPSPTARSGPRGFVDRAREALDEPHGVAHALDRLELLVGDLDAVAILERLDELDELERVDVEVGPLRLERGPLGAGDLHRGELAADLLEDLVVGQGGGHWCSPSGSGAQRAVDGQGRS